MAGNEVLIAPCIKANAYGHGLVGMAQILETIGADWFCVNSIEEAVLCLKTKVIQVKKLKKGSGVSYDCGFVANDDMKVALLPIGYYDGYD